MGTKYSLRRMPRIPAALLCLALLLPLLLPSHALAEDSADVLCLFDAEQDRITVEQSVSIRPAGERLLCIAAILREDGRLLFCGMGERTDSGTLSVSCPLSDLSGNGSIRLFFLDEAFCPVAPARTYQVTVTAPSCTRSGSVIVEDAAGAAQLLRTLPAEGHAFSEPIVQEPTDAVHCGKSERSCTRCGQKEITPLYPACTIARLRLYGDLTGIGKKAEVPLTVSFRGGGLETDCYALLKYQGHTSLVYDKKNYTLKLFHDAEHTRKNKLTFFDWNKEHKYILKANYVDGSVCRNLVCADIWSEMAACRSGHEARLEACSNYGATDGFPVALYLNDTFQGLYTFTLHRDDDLFEMEDGQKDAILVTNTAQSDAAFFRAPAVFDGTGDWEVEFSGLEDTLWAEDKLNALIQLVRTASDDELRSQLAQQLDVNSALDYLIAIYALGLTNSGAKNMTLATYEDGPLFFSLCDMEDAFGLSPTGESVYAPSQFLPSCTDGVWDSATGSLLWDRMLQVFLPEFRSRYAQLRQEILTAERICGKVSAYLEPISEEFFAADQALYPDKPQLTTPHETQIETYVTQRLQLLDELFLSGDRT